MPSDPSETHGDDEPSASGGGDPDATFPAADVDRRTDVVRHGPAEPIDSTLTPQPPATQRT